MLRHALGLARLMRESTDRVEAALHSSDGGERWIASRVLESPLQWQRWESEHAMLMRQLAGCSVQHAQVEALKQTTFRLVHGKALFDYLRHKGVRPAARLEVIAHFRPGRSFESALIAEHGAYLRKACSYLCTSHLGAEVVRDPAFLDPMQRYAQLYTEYFTVYCNSLVAEATGRQESQRSLLPLLKQQLNEYRLAILDPRAAQPFLRREAELRRPSGDTQRLPRLPRLPHRPKERR